MHSSRHAGQMIAAGLLLQPYSETCALPEYCWTDVSHLAQHSLSLHADTLHTVHHHQGAISDTQGCCNLTGEVNVSGRVNEVDEVVITMARLGEALELLLRNLVVQGDTCTVRSRTSSYV